MAYYKVFTNDIAIITIEIASITVMIITKVTKLFVNCIDRFHSLPIL